MSIAAQTTIDPERGALDAPNSSLANFRGMERDHLQSAARRRPRSGIDGSAARLIGDHADAVQAIAPVACAGSLRSACEDATNRAVYFIGGLMMSRGFRLSSPAPPAMSSTSTRRPLQRSQSGRRACPRRRRTRRRLMTSRLADPANRRPGSQSPLRAWPSPPCRPPHRNVDVPTAQPTAVRAALLSTASAKIAKQNETSGRTRRREPRRRGRTP